MSVIVLSSEGSQFDGSARVDSQQRQEVVDSHQPQDLLDTVGRLVSPKERRQNNP